MYDGLYTQLPLTVGQGYGPALFGKLLKPWPVPYALRGKLSDELQWFEADGVI